MQVDGKQHQIDLTLVQESEQRLVSSIAAAHAKPGDTLIGKIVKGKGNTLEYMRSSCQKETQIILQPIQQFVQDTYPDITHLGSL